MQWDPPPADPCAAQADSTSSGAPRSGLADMGLRVTYTHCTAYRLAPRAKDENHPRATLSTLTTEGKPKAARGSEQVRHRCSVGHRVRNLVCTRMASRAGGRATQSPLHAAPCHTRMAVRVTLALQKRLQGRCMFMYIHEHSLRAHMHNPCIALSPPAVVTSGVTHPRLPAMAGL